MEHKAQFLFACENKKYFIKIIGVPRYTNCANFNYFVNTLLKTNDFEDILIDIRETQFLDSTCLGLLAKLAGAVFTKFNRRMALISTEADINELLKNTGFDKIMLIIDQPNFFLSNLNSLPESPDVEQNMAKMMLEAHENLVLLSSENKKKFKAVVDMLSEEVKHQNINN